MAIKSKANLTIGNNIAITDPLGKQNTASLVRGDIQDVIDSSLNIIDILTGSVSIANLYVGSINGSTAGGGLEGTLAINNNSGAQDIVMGIDSIIHTTFIEPVDEIITISSGGVRGVGEIQVDTGKINMASFDNINNSGIDINTNKISIYSNVDGFHHGDDSNIQIFAPGLTSSTGSISGVFVNGSIYLNATDSSSRSTSTASIFLGGNNNTMGMGIGNIISGSNNSMNEGNNNFILGHNNYNDSGDNNFISGNNNINTDGDSNVYLRGSNTNTSGNQVVYIGDGNHNISGNKTKYIGDSNTNINGDLNVYLGIDCIGPTAGGSYNVYYGDNNTSFSTLSLIGGKNNQNNSPVSIISGSGNINDHSGAIVYGAASTNTLIGHSGIFSMGNTTIDNSNTLLSTEGTGFYKGFVISLNCTYRADITVLCTDTSSGDSREWHGSGIVRNISGTTTLQGTSFTMTSTFGDTSLLSTAISITANNTTDTLDITVNGLNSHTINWISTIRYEKTIFK